MKILSSCFWQQLINFAVYVFLRRFSLPAPLSFQKKRSFHFIWISQNLLGPLIRGGKALIQGQNSNPQPFILVLAKFSSSCFYMCCLTYFSMVFVDFHGLGAVWLSNSLVNGEYGKIITNDDDEI